MDIKWGIGFLYLSSTDHPKITRMADFVMQFKVFKIKLINQQLKPWGYLFIHFKTDPSICLWKKEEKRTAFFFAAFIAWRKKDHI